MTLPLLPILLAAGSAVAYAWLDLLRKLLAARIRPLPLLFFMAAGPVPVFLAWQVASGESWAGAGYWLPGGVSVLLNIGSNLAFLEAVRVAPLSLTIPLLSLTPVFTTLLALPILGERPAPLQMLGVVVVVLGAMYLHGGRGGGSGKPGDAAAHRKGALLMALTALLWSLATPLDKLAIQASSTPFHATLLNGGVALGILVMLLARRQTAQLAAYRGHVGMLAWTVLATLLGLTFFLLAISQIWVGLVETLKRGLGSLLAVILGRLFFGEAITPRKIVAILVMAGGTALLLWS